MRLFRPRVPIEEQLAAQTTETTPIKQLNEDPFDFDFDQVDAIPTASLWGNLHLQTDLSQQPLWCNSWLTWDGNRKER